MKIGKTNRKMIDDESRESNTIRPFTYCSILGDDDDNDDDNDDDEANTINK